MLLLEPLRFVFSSCSGLKSNQQMTYCWTTIAEQKGRKSIADNGFLTYGVIVALKEIESPPAILAPSVASQTSPQHAQYDHPLRHQITPHCLIRNTLRFMS